MTVGLPLITVGFTIPKRSEARPAWATAILAKMTVTIAECNSPPLQEGARIRQISDDQAKLLFECEEDSTLDVTIVDPGNAVILRDKNSRVEYLG